MAGTPGSDDEEPRRSTGVRRPVLTRHDVLVAALRLIDADGVDALSMRRLGRALDRDPMRLYRFAASKKEGGKPLPSAHNDGYAPQPGPSIKVGVRTMAMAVMDLMPAK